MKLHVHILTKFDQSFIERFKSLIPSEITVTSGEEIHKETEILIAGMVDETQIAPLNKLMTLVVPWAGLPVKTRETMLEFPNIAIHNIHHNAKVVAEHAISLMFACAKHIIPIDRSLRNNDWTIRYNEKHNIQLSGRTALILGYGAIGKEIGRICTAIGMKVNAIKRNVTASQDGSAKIYGLDSLGDLLGSANVLFVALPRTPETNNLIDKKALRALPDKAIVINIARAAIINEEALYNELKTGRISAGLDVWYNYPDLENERTNTSPSKYDFNRLDNVVMTPHLSGHSDATENLRISALANLINLASEDAEIPNKVNPEIGY